MGYKVIEAHYRIMTIFLRLALQVRIYIEGTRSFDNKMTEFKVP